MCTYCRWLPGADLEGHYRCHHSRSGICYTIHDRSFALTINIYSSMTMYDVHANNGEEASAPTSLVSVGYCFLNLDSKFQSHSVMCAG